MRLHLLRHAKAVPRGGTSDAKRPLAEEGRTQARRVARGLDALGIQPDVIATSPFTRARETAHLVADVQGFRGETRQLGELMPDADPADTRKALARLQPAEDVLVTGHKPHLPKLVAHLLTGEPDGVDVRVGKACLCTVDIALGTPEALGRLERLMQADEIGRLGR